MTHIDKIVQEFNEIIIKIGYTMPDSARYVLMSKRDILLSFFRISLEAQEKRLKLDRKAIKDILFNEVQIDDIVDKILTLQPPCSTCGGTTTIPTDRSDFDMCPDCNKAKESDYE